MKKYTFLLLLTFLSAISFGQTNRFKVDNLSIGYYGHYIFHPGIKIGTQFDLKNWNKEKIKKNRTKTKEKSFFLSPQIGYYSHPKNHSGLLLNAELGYQTLKTKRGFYQAYSIGVGALTQFNAGTTYNYDKGDIKEKKFASRTYLMPTINVELGQRINERIGWFTKVSIGSKLLYNSSFTLDGFMEAGVKINLSTRN